MLHNFAAGHGKYSPLLAASSKGFRSTIHVSTLVPGQLVVGAPL